MNWLTPSIQSFSISESRFPRFIFTTSDLSLAVVARSNLSFVVHSPDLHPHCIAAMPHSRFSGTLSSPNVDFAIDMGHPFLNHTVDGFLKIGAVGACKVLAEETFECLKSGNVSKGKAEHILKKMLKEGAYWGTVAGVYVGSEYGIERIRDRYDWKNAMLGGAVTGAVMSATINHQHGKDRIVRDAITGAAVATAAEFINYLTFY